jgi:methionyl-tRNA synthetase
VATDPSLMSGFQGLTADVATLLDRLEVTQALELIWQRVRRLNRYVEERAPWQLARDPSNAAALDETLASLAEGVRVVSVLLHPYIPASSARLLEAIGAPRFEYDAASFSPHVAGGSVSALEPLFPKRG